jgi:hypothetical protein
MESALMTSASGRPKAFREEGLPKSSSRRAVLPDAVGPTRTRIVGLDDESVLNLLGEYLASCERDYLAVVLFDFRGFQHREMICAPRDRDGDLIDVAVVFDKLFKGHNHKSILSDPMET